MIVVSGSFYSKLQKRIHWAWTEHRRPVEDLGIWWKGIYIWTQGTGLWVRFVHEYYIQESSTSHWYQLKILWLFSKQIFVTATMIFQKLLNSVCNTVATATQLTCHTLTSTCIFSKLFSIHFLSCWQGEFL